MDNIYFIHFPKEEEKLTFGATSMISRPILGIFHIWNILSLSNIFVLVNCIIFRTPIYTYNPILVGRWYRYFQFYLKIEWSASGNVWNYLGMWHSDSSFFYLSPRFQFLEIHRENNKICILYHTVSRMFLFTMI